MECALSTQRHDGSVDVANGSNDTLLNLWKNCNCPRRPFSKRQSKGREGIGQAQRHMLNTIE